MENQPKDIDATFVDWEIDGKKIRLHAPNELSLILAKSSGEAEPETLEWLRTAAPGEILYDLGASNGVFSLYAAIARRMQVFAFEPEAQNYALLETNLYLNKKSASVAPRAFCVAISAKLGYSEMYSVRNAPGFHMKVLGRPVRVGETEEFIPDHVQSILTLPLDDAIRLFGLPLPNLVKIDVDGAEQDVIAGSHSLLARPELRSLLIELTTSDAATSSIALELQQFGFVLQKAHPVRHLRGGFYDGLFNCVFERSRQGGAKNV